MGYTFPFYTPTLPRSLSNSLENENINKKNNKKTPRDIIILHKCVTKIMIMIIGYTVPEIWRVTDIIAIFHSGQFPIYLPSSPPKKNSKNWKKHLEMSSFNTSVPKIMITCLPKIMIICFTVPEIWRVTDVIVIFSFWAIFCPFIPLTDWNLKVSKNWKKNTCRYHHFTQLY